MQNKLTNDGNSSAHESNNPNLVNVWKQLETNKVVVLV